MKIILATWASYGVKRVKELGCEWQCGVHTVLQNMQRYDGGVDFDLVLVINAASTEQKPVYMHFKEEYSFVHDVIFRSNMGFDFGAYNRGYQLLRASGYSGDVVFMNCAVNGPHRDGWLEAYHRLFHARGEHVGAVGASTFAYAGHQVPEETAKKIKKVSGRLPVIGEWYSRYALRKYRAPHLQSYFIYTSMDVLTDVFAGALPGANVKDDKLRLISEGEIGLSRSLLDAGYSISCVQFDGFYYRKGGQWRVYRGNLRKKTMNSIARVKIF